MLLGLLLFLQDRIVRVSEIFLDYQLNILKQMLAGIVGLRRLVFIGYCHHSRCGSFGINCFGFLLTFWRLLSSAGLRIGIRRF